MDVMEETRGDVTYVKTDPALPPVAVIDRTPMSGRSKLVFAAVALIGAIAWAVIAFVRGETVNAVWFVVAAVCTYVIGFRFYARLIETKIVRPRDEHATPAEIYENGTDYLPTDRRVLFGHHFAAIAGAGPLVGPVLATQMGYLPGTIWILLGAVFAGCVQDFLVLSISTRRRGRSLGQMARDELGPVGGAAAIIGVLVIMVILLAVLALVVVNALAESPWGVFSIAMTIPIAIFMGLYLRVFRPGRVSEVSLIGVVLLLAAVVAGGWVAETDWGTQWFTLSKVTLSWCIIIYGLAASVLPVWFLLAPRDYLSTFMKVGTIALLALGILIARPVMQAPAVSQFASSGAGPVFAGSLFPFLFITIACGALSGFHSLISSGTTPKLLEKESQMRVIGYGGMLTESFVAIMALITASILDQHLYFAINAPTAATGGTAGDRRRLRQRPGPVRSAGHRRRRSAMPPRAWRRSRSCRAPAVRRRWRSACPRCSPARSAAAGSRRSGITSRSCSRRCSSSPPSTPGPGSRGSCSPTPWPTSVGRCAGCATRAGGWAPGRAA